MILKLQKYKWHLVLALSVIILCSAVLYNQIKAIPAGASQAVSIVVKNGMSSNDIAKLLYQKGLIKSEFLFHVAVRLKGMENSLQAGEYLIPTEMTVPQMISMLAKGETIYREITIPEGYTIEQIAKLLEDNQIGNAAKLKELAKNATPFPYMSENQNPNVTYKAEGYLFPDTYRIAKGVTEEQVMSMMLTQFDKQFTKEMRERATSLGLSIRDVVILASLVEKEARLSQDRPIIAGVFLNRLKIQMPLQSCASIQYILGYPKAELTVKDTEIPSPYNTYQNMGLPPGPIANPGIASIEAVLNAAKTDYLYFVADEQGAHHFSKTYEEHLTSIEQVRK